MSNNIDEILKLNTEDLYKLMEADDAIDVDISLEDLSSLGIDESLGEKATTDLLSKAKLSLPVAPIQNSLRKIWPKVRFVICTIYKNDPKIGEKELIDAVIAALGISGNWAIALVALALKLGLDKLCSIYK
ncbi:hypothetical protein [Acinetobacter gerneri]|jgi:hypothetical protein|uniref:Uncharacterized protein n=1 Tax=Acinetobacter gerneri DSM 14967 = CIP 107464 = MTCC 9824 TaxID=1120926 RepID=N8YF90_9GAMM|nr:hypothetical protein [Acinetobacter gerneri]ENV35472.1 hypothetical protein F960_00296 [Acinetobacter gerneri DSM 14967 = CIP 107464 = MTCC 9824]EPR82480.1 hypothetical protein L289_2999 [Acinetobacter gerneri DSM 14967 = CIP 107464 = MTCC 9824]